MYGSLIIFILFCSKLNKTRISVGKGRRWRLLEGKEIKEEHKFYLKIKKKLNKYLESNLL